MAIDVKTSVVNACMFIKGNITTVKFKSCACIPFYTYSNKPASLLFFFLFIFDGMNINDMSHKL